MILPRKFSSGHQPRKSGGRGSGAARSAVPAQGKWGGRVRGSGRVGEPKARRRLGADGPAARIPGRRSAYTLLELLLVLGLVASLSAALLVGVRGNPAVALQAGQSLVVNLVTAARARAVAGGNPTRLLLHREAASVHAPTRYLRYLVLQEFDPVARDWATVSAVFLPTGVYLFPAQSLSPAFFREPNAWTLEDSAPWRSHAFAEAPLTLAVNSLVPETWDALAFDADGVPAFDRNEEERHSLILGLARILPPGSAAPLAFDQPENVRGLTLGNYGVPILVNERSSF